MATPTPPLPPLSQIQCTPFMKLPCNGVTPLQILNLRTYRLPDTEAAVWVPPVDPTWLLTGDMHQLVLAIDSNLNVLLVGDQGVGKTEIVKQMCALRNWPCTRVMMSEGVREADLFGRWTAHNNSMVWLRGPVQRAVEEGHVLLIDEIDFADPGHLVALRGLLEVNNRLLMLNGKDGSVVKPHPQFRICAAANSIGNSNKLNFVGAREMNHADLRRFGWTIRMTHFEFDMQDTTKQLEVDIIMQKLKSTAGASLPNGMTVGGVTVSWDQIRSTVLRMVKVANLCRGANKNSEIMYSFGISDTIQWAMNYLLLANAGVALLASVLHKLDSDDFTVIEKIHMAEFGES